jgi:hypothetical protein
VNGLTLDRGKKHPPSLPPWKTVKTTVGLAGTLKNDLKTAASCKTLYKLRKKLLKKKSEKDDQGIVCFLT